MIKIDNACGAKTSVWVCAPVCTCVSFCVSVWETRGKPRASGSWTPHMPHHSPSLPSAEAEAAERRDNAFITVNSSSRQRVVNESSTSRQRTLNHRSTDLTKSHSSTHMFEKTGQIHNISKKEMKSKEKLSNRKHWCSRFKIQGKQTKPKPNHSRFSRCQNQTF